jgi:uncharacterized membrane protein YvbJ
MKLCPYCSKEMEDDALLCKHCGRDWKTGTGWRDQMPPNDSEQAAGTPDGRFWWALAILLIAGLVAAFCAAIPEIH